MIIKTKFDIDQTIYYVDNGHMFKSKIVKINIYSDVYDYSIEESYYPLMEDDLFATEEEAIKKLKK